MLGRCNTPGRVRREAGQIAAEAKRICVKVRKRTFVLEKEHFFCMPILLVHPAEKACIACSVVAGWEYLCENLIGSGSRPDVSSFAANRRGGERRSCRFGAMGGVQ